jgi:hypothetical protein
VAVVDHKIIAADNPLKLRILIEKILEEVIENFRYYIDEFSICRGYNCINIAKDAVNHIAADVDLASAIVAQLGATAEVAEVEAAAYEAAQALEAAAYEAQDADMSWGLYYLAKAAYAALRGDVKTAVFLILASYAYLIGRGELARQIVREALGEEGARDSELFHKLGRLLHGLARAGIRITGEDLEE